jgi:choline dehydrogenase-like flavoprotein
VLRDGRRVSNGAELRSDVCIVGAGPAGLALAAELSHAARMHIAIVDSGGPEQDPAADALSQLEFESPHFASPNDTRRRQLGGMAARWDAALPRGLGARLLRLDPIDFEPRDWVPHSGWPFDRAALDPYYDRAEVLLGLPPSHGEPDRGVDVGGGAVPISESVAITTAERLVARERVTRDLVERVGTRPNVTLLHHATAVEIETEDGPAAVRAVRIRCGIDSAFTIAAKTFVLAAGTIEIARLLLASNKVHRKGLGNDHDNVGRYFMDHPYVIGGFLRPRDRRLFDRLGLYDIRKRDGALHSARLRVAEEAQRSERLLNSSLQLQPRLSERYRRSLDAGRRLARSLRGGRLPVRPLRELTRLSPALRGLLLPTAELGLRQRRIRPQLSKVGWSQLRGNSTRFDHLTLVLQPEQSPEPEHRITLSERRDALGMPVARLRTGWSDLDLRSIERTCGLLGKEFTRKGIGELAQGGEDLAAELADAGIHGPRSDGPPLLMPEGAHHHLGATRMHRDAASGVVDEHCRVHAAANLYVAGGSVFPTSGSANPTLTAVALAIRLADHIRGELTPGVLDA